MQPLEAFPPPWTLSGRGLILVYRLPKPWLLEHGHIPAHLEPQFVGGLSALMLVDYAQSNCGAYRELLFVPGQFRSPDGNFWSISRIYVSSQASVDNGIANWGIPKEFVAAPRQPRAGELGQFRRICLLEFGVWVADGFTQPSCQLAYFAASRADRAQFRACIWQKPADHLIRQRHDAPSTAALGSSQCGTFSQFGTSAPCGGGAG
jgi:hypothetical protein